MSREQRAESREQRAESREQRAAISEQRAESREQRAESREQSREQSSEQSRVMRSDQRSDQQAIGVQAATAASEVRRVSNRPQRTHCSGKSKFRSEDEKEQHIYIYTCCTHTCSITVKTTTMLCTMYGRATRSWSGLYGNPSRFLSEGR